MKYSHLNVGNYNKWTTSRTTAVLVMAPFKTSNHSTIKFFLPTVTTRGSSLVTDLYCCINWSCLNQDSVTLSPYWWLQPSVITLYSYIKGSRGFRTLSANNRVSQEQFMKLPGTFVTLLSWTLTVYTSWEDGWHSLLDLRKNRAWTIIKISCKMGL